MVEIGTAVRPDEPPSVETLEYRDRSWSPEYRLERVMASRAGQVVGWGEVSHLWWAYHPDRYRMRVEVEPAVQRQGIGSAIFEQIVDRLRGWKAALVRAEARASDTHVLDFWCIEGLSRSSDAGSRA